MQDINNLPTLRFPEFTGSWVKRKFKDFVEERIEFPEENLPLYSLTIENGVTPKTSRYERSFLVKSDKDAYKVVHKNDFVYNPMNIRFGAIAKHNKNHKVLVSKYYNVFNIDDSMDTNFIEYFLKTNRMIGFYNKMATGSLIEKRRVHYSDFIEFIKLFPDVDEQKKIASFLSFTSGWIKNLEEQCTSLEVFKTGVVQELFAQKVRFLDQNGKSFPNWQKRKFEEVLIEHGTKKQNNEEVFSVSVH